MKNHWLNKKKEKSQMFVTSSGYLDVTWNDIYWSGTATATIDVGINVQTSSGQIINFVDNVTNGASFSYYIC